MELSDIAGENVKQYNHFDKLSDSSLESSTCIHHVTQEYSSPQVSLQNMSFFKNCYIRDFPGGPVVETSPSNARSAGSISGLGAKIPHASPPKEKTKT